MTRTMTISINHEEIEDAVKDYLTLSGYVSFPSEIVRIDFGLPVNSEGQVDIDLEVSDEEEIIQEDMPLEDRANLDHFLQSAQVLPFTKRA